MYVVTLARKPLSEPTVATNALEHGSGAVAIAATALGSGRWPANLVLTERGAADLDGQTSHLLAQGAPKLLDTGKTAWFGGGDPGTFYGDAGGASRFFKVVSDPAK